MTYRMTFIYTFFFLCVTKFTWYYIRIHRTHTKENMS
jgi:hypothetical protein